VLFTGEENSIKEIFDMLGTPVIIKSPYTRFSSHVEKANNREEFIDISKKFLRKSKVVIVQEYIRSDFDWRVGILNNEILYRCKYCILKGDGKLNQR